MKKRKILFLLAAVLSVTLLLVGCGKGDGDFSEYFKPLPKEDAPSYTELSKLEGEYVTYNSDHSVVAVRETDVDILGGATETFKVIDLETDKLLFEKSYDWDNFGDEKKISRYEHSISLKYFPLIQIERNHIYWSGSEPNYTKNESKSYSYYLPTGKADNDDVSSYITEHSNDKEPEVNVGVNIYSFVIGDYTYIYDGKFKKINLDTAFGWDSESAVNINSVSFNMYKNGLFYAKDDRAVTVYDKSLVPVAHYELGYDDGECGIFYLNNGNILVQELIPTKNADYDVKFVKDDFSSDTYYLNSYVINAKSGKTSEIKLDFLVVEKNFPSFVFKGEEFKGEEQFFEGFFAPTAKTENVAAIMKIVDRTADVNSGGHYAALDNTGKALAISPAIGFDEKVRFVTADRAIRYTENGAYICDASLNNIAYVCDGEVDFEVVNGHVLIENKLYDLNMKLVYDFTADGDVEPLVMSGVLFIGTESEVLPETYTVSVYDFKKGAPTVVADGISAELYFEGSLPYGLYGIVKQESFDKATVLNVYNTDGKLLFECLDTYSYNVIFDSYGVVLLEVNGSYYVLR